MINRLDSEFIIKDYKLLKTVFDVGLVSPPRMSSKEYTSWCVKNLIPTMAKAMKCDYIYSWWCTSTFASVVGKLTGTKVILIAGGYDTVKDTMLMYGAFVNKKLGVLTKLNMKNAYKILCVGSKLIGNIKQIDKALVDKCEIVPTGYNTFFWKNYNRTGRNFKTTICINSGDVAKAKIRHLVKGIDRFVNMARKDPDNGYLLIGYEIGLLQKLEKNVPNNVMVVGKFSRDQILQALNKTKYYCQLSRHEGYPNAVCEALLCGCSILYSDEVPEIDKHEIITPRLRLDMIKKVMI